MCTRCYGKTVDKLKLALEDRDQNPRDQGASERSIHETTETHLTGSITSNPTLTSEVLLNPHVSTTIKPLSPFLSPFHAHPTRSTKLTSGPTFPWCHPLIRGHQHTNETQLYCLSFWVLDFEGETSESFLQVTRKCKHTTIEKENPSGGWGQRIFEPYAPSFFPFLPSRRSFKEPQRTPLVLLKAI